MIMKIKHILLTGAALVALTGATVVAQARTKAEEDAITRQLNLDQLAKAQAGGAQTTTMPSTPDSREGQGGPELKGPPGPNEGMDDEATPSDQTAPNDQATPPEQSDDTSEGAPPPVDTAPDAGRQPTE